MFSACSSDEVFNVETDLSKLGVTENTEISQVMAWSIVKKLIMKDQLDNIYIYVSKNTIQTNTMVEICCGYEDKSPDYESWLFFIDDMPFANWAHPCRYIYVNIVGGEYEVHEHKMPPKSLGEVFTPLSQIPFVSTGKSLYD